MAEFEEFEKLFSVDIPPDIYNSMKDKIKLVVRGKTGDCESKYLSGVTGEDGSKRFMYRWLCIDGALENEERTLIVGFFEKKKSGENIHSEFEVRTIGGVVTKRALDIKSKLISDFSGKLDTVEEVVRDKILLGEGKFCSTFPAVIPVEICSDNPKELSLFGELVNEFKLYPKFAYYAVQKYKGMLSRERHPIVFANKFGKEELDLYELDYSRVKKLFEKIKESSLYEREI
jgi:hypothetical protein